MTEHDSRYQEIRLSFTNNKDNVTNCVARPIASKQIDLKDTEAFNTSTGVTKQTAHNLHKD